MKKEDVIQKLMEVTGKSEKDCIAINAILEDHFIIGRNNQDKIEKDFVEKLGLSKEEADKLYNDCASVIVKGIFRK